MRLLSLYTIVGIVFLYAPIVLLLVFSLNDSIYVVFPLKGFTWNWYRQLFSNADIFVSFTNSLRVALVSALTATTLATLAAKAVTRYKFRGRGVSVSLLMLPMIIPEIVLGTSLLILLMNWGLNLSLLTVTIGHIVVCTPFALAVMISRFAGFDKSLEEASLDLGESGLGTFFRVTLPLVWPGIVSSLLLCFLISFDDFVTSFFLIGTEKTLPLHIWSQMRFARKLPEVLALGSCVFVASLVVLTIAERLRRMGEFAKET